MKEEDIYIFVVLLTLIEWPAIKDDQGWTTTFDLICMVALEVWKE